MTDFKVGDRVHFESDGKITWVGHSTLDVQFDGLEFLQTLTLKEADKVMTVIQPPLPTTISSIVETAEGDRYVLVNWVWTNVLSGMSYPTHLLQLERPKVIYNARENS